LPVCSKTHTTKDVSYKAYFYGSSAKLRKRQEAAAKQAEQGKELGEKNKKDGEAFLAENKKKEGVKTTPSGLQYKVIVAGTGKIPSASDTVVTQYRGTFIDGKEFDSSYKREPFVTQVSSVIKGWTEALTMMPVGSKWQLFIPSDLAYGAGNRGIPANSTLLFDMELISIQDKAKEEKPAIPVSQGTWNVICSTPPTATCTGPNAPDVTGLPPDGPGSPRKRRCPMR